jgi:crotonobetaine/carnitine-CoA ligase
VSVDDVAVMLPTSGTTGRPKLVMQTHRAYVMTAEAFPHWIGLTCDDRLMTVLPLFHLNALGYSFLGALGAGASLALIPRFSASRFLDDARRHGATQFNAIGTVLEILMRQDERDDDADNPLRLCYAAPAPPDETRHVAFEERFGLRITAGYGQSESPFGTIWPRERRPYGSIGVPRQHPVLGKVNEARIVDDGEDVAEGDTGELLLRNPSVTPGYFERPEETAAALEGGWLHTGDLVRREDGIIYFVARAKQIVRRRGENISQAEVEGVIDAHPAVVECAVVGVPSDLGEEEIKAFVVASGDVGAAEIREWVRERLSDFKAPRYVEFVDSLPKTPTERIAKHELPTERTEAEHDLRPD